MSSPKHIHELRIDEISHSDLSALCILLELGFNIFQDVAAQRRREALQKLVVLEADMNLVGPETNADVLARGEAMLKRFHAFNDRVHETAGLRTPSTKGEPTP